MGRRARHGDRAAPRPRPRAVGDPDVVVGAGDRLARLHHPGRPDEHLGGGCAAPPRRRAPRHLPARWSRAAAPLGGRALHGVHGRGVARGGAMDPRLCPGARSERRPRRRPAQRASRDGHADDRRGGEHRAGGRPLGLLDGRRRRARRRHHDRRRRDGRRPQHHRTRCRHRPRRARRGGRDGAVRRDGGHDRRRVAGHAGRLRRQRLGPVALPAPGPPLGVGARLRRLVHRAGRRPARGPAPRPARARLPAAGRRVLRRRGPGGIPRRAGRDGARAAHPGRAHHRHRASAGTRPHRGLPPGAQPRRLAGVGDRAPARPGAHPALPDLCQPAHARVAARPRGARRHGRRGLDRAPAAEDDDGLRRRLPRGRHPRRRLRARPWLDADRAGQGRQAGLPRQLGHDRSGPARAPRRARRRALGGPPEVQGRARAGSAARRCGCVAPHPAATSSAPTLRPCGSR